MQLRYEAVESHDLGQLALSCAFTVFFWGGTCWAYLAAPFAGQQITALAHAQADGPIIGRCVTLRGLDVEGAAAGFGVTARRVRVTGADGRELEPFEVQRLCDPPEPPPSPSTPVPSTPVPAS